MLKNFDQLINNALWAMRMDSELVLPKFWQSIDVANKPEMATHEVQNYHAKVFEVPETIRLLQEDCHPSLPWAEDHFQERVCGEPLNPGNTWQTWPYALKADSFRDAKGQFNHNYMERYWPRYAGVTKEGKLDELRLPGLLPDYGPDPHFGIRNRYGDLQDVVNLFISDPLTRQAYLPIFFPEDTGTHHLGRVPCTLGYHFMIRNGKLHIVYFMRSCDLRRHFNDDIYLTARLQVWLLQQLRAAAPSVFGEITTGTFTIFIASLHIFKNDWRALFGDTPTPGSLAASSAVVAGPKLPAGESYGGQQVKRPFSYADFFADPRGFGKSES